MGYWQSSFILLAGFLNHPGPSIRYLRMVGPLSQYGETHRLNHMRPLCQDPFQFWGLGGKSAKCGRALHLPANSSTNVALDGIRGTLLASGNSALHLRRMYAAWAAKLTARAARGATARRASACAGSPAGQICWVRLLYNKINGLSHVLWMNDRVFQIASNNM